mgnify:CR=1 FL=1
MDRFIDYTYSVILRALKSLKSNMDRFIGSCSCYDFKKNYV